MVFQFEHVGIDHGGSKWDPLPLDLLDLKASLGRWQAGLADDRVEQPVLEQPRPAAHRVALGRRRRAPRPVGDDAGDGPAPPPRHAVRVPGRGARDDERRVHLDRRVPRHRGAQPLPRRRRAAARTRPPCWPRWATTATTPARRCSGTTRPHAGFTTGTPWIAVNPNHTTINARAARADDRLGVPPLPAADRAAPHRPRSSSTATSRCCSPDHPHVYAFTRALGDEAAARRRQLLRRPPVARRDPGRRRVGRRRARDRQRRRPGRR